MRLIFVLFLLLTACSPFSDCKEVNLSKKNLRWMEPFVEGDDISFVSENGREKRFKVQAKEST